MAAHSFTVRSALGKAEVFARVADLSTAPQWDEGISSSTRQVDDDGAEWFEIVTTGFDGAPMASRYAIVAAQAPDHFTMVGSNDVFRAIDTVVVFDRDDGGCDVHYHGTLQLLGDAPPLTDTQLDAMFPKLAAVAEQGLATFLNP